MRLFAVAAVALLLSWALTGWVRRYAIQRDLLDLPNERSLHQRPVPRGGGLAIVAVTLGGILLAALLGWISARVAVGLIGGGGTVALVGWVDDRRGLAPGIKAIAQIGAALWALVWLGGLPELRWGDGSLHLGVAGLLVGVVGIVWGANFYNFMDGIDGLAAGEAVTISAGAIFLLWGTGLIEVLLVAALLAGSSAGFLLWNWPPARIFLGDVGSAFLGFMFAVLAVLSETRGGLPVMGWLLLLGAFFMDATLTVGRRIARREPWYQAHRTHAYQRAVGTGLSHRTVTLAIMGLNLALIGLTWLGWVQPGLMPAMIGLGALFLLAVYLVVEGRSPMAGAS